MPPDARKLTAVSRPHPASPYEWTLRVSGVAVAGIKPETAIDAITDGVSPQIAPSNCVIYLAYYSEASRE
jgi:hypothetical protein